MSKLAVCGSVLFLLAGCASAEEEAAPAQAERSAQMQVVPLQHAAAAELAAELGMLLREARVVADQRTNSLLIVAETEAALAEVLEVIEDLDVKAPD
jgi:type II secretory pathway component GspD/PulD (secretin)